VFEDLHVTRQCWLQNAQPRRHLDKECGNRNKKRRVLKVLSSSNSQTKYIQPVHPVNAARITTGVLSMKLGFICPKASGHLNPITALARRLQARNHDVVFLYSSGAAGRPFVPGPAEDRIDQTIAEVSKLQGEEAFKVGISWIMTQAETILKSLPAIVQANGVDALVIDTVQFYAELGAMRLGMPYIHVSAAMYHDYSGCTPICHYGWPHQTTPAAPARNREGVAKFVKLLESGNAGVRAYAESFGLKIDWEDPGSTLSPLASITHPPR
jgi:zeaxanthin glucosyltransferase